jgi:hypothetical protein
MKKFFSITIHFCKVFGIGMAFSKPHTEVDTKYKIKCICISAKIYLILWLFNINIPIRKSTV